MSESQITVGDLSSFLLYAAYVGVSVGGEYCIVSGLDNPQKDQVG